MSLEERDGAKTGERIFVETMEGFEKLGFEESFKRFKKAAEKGHKESCWICDVVKDMEVDDDENSKQTLLHAFAETECPMGWYWAGRFCDFDSRTALDFYQKSSDGGYSWGQLMYGLYFFYGKFVKKDEEAYLELLNKAVVQRNPQSMYMAGYWWYESNYSGKEEAEKARMWYQAASELRWQHAMYGLAAMCYFGEGGEKDLIQAARLGFVRGGYYFWQVLGQAHAALETERTIGYLGCDFNLLVMELGKGLYWNCYGTSDWSMRTNDDEKKFGEKCLDYYCSVIELQQQAIFLFLQFWNKYVKVKGPGQIIGRLVWQGRFEYLVKEFEV